jgi:hypothetical protein
MRSSAGVIAMGKGADVGVGRKTARKRAVGTREHIIAYLTEVNELYDANGMASTRLAAAVGYPGSSVAFAQLLSGMERSGLIEREVRGKRTYRITLGTAHAVGAGGAARAVGMPEVAMAVGGFGGVGGPGGVGGEVGSGVGAAAFDYDELARRLLVQVVRRLAATEPEASPPDRSAPGGLAPDRSAPGGLTPDRLASDALASDRLALQETVSGLEYELAAAWTKHGKLAEENVRLREQLRAAQRSLALAAERIRRLPVSTDLDRSEVVLLQRLLASDSVGAADSPGAAPDSLAAAPEILADADGPGEAGSMAEAPSLLG